MTRDRVQSTNETTSTDVPDGVTASPTDHGSWLGALAAEDRLSADHIAEALPFRAMI